MRQRQLAHHAMRSRPHLWHHLEKGISESDDVGALAAIGRLWIPSGSRREDDGAGGVGTDLRFQGLYAFDLRRVISSRPGDRAERLDARVVIEKQRPLVADDDFINKRRIFLNFGVEQPVQMLLIL